MNQERVDELLVYVTEQARNLRIPVSGRIQPHVKLNRRAKNRFGCCILKNGVYTIELSAQLIESSEQAVCQVLAHEVLHTCPDCSNHGPGWKTWAAQMNAAYGYSISRTYSPEKLGLPAEAPAPYLLVCTKCGAEIGRIRQTALVKHPEHYRCRCGGKLERRR